MVQRLQFDPARLSRADKLLLGISLCYLVNLFLPWNQLCDGQAGCIRSSGWSGIGTLNGVLVIALLVWVGRGATGPAHPALPPNPTVTAAGAGLVLALTAVRAALQPTVLVVLLGEYPLARHTFLWVGLILAGLLAVAAYLKQTEGRQIPPRPGHNASGTGSGTTTTPP